MGTVALVCFVIGCIVLAFYRIQIVLIAYKESTAWAVICFYVPLADFYYVITRWQKCKSPFLRSLLALPFIFFSFYVISTGAGGPGYEMIDTLP